MDEKNIDLVLIAQKDIKRLLDNNDIIEQIIPDDLVMKVSRAYSERHLFYLNFNTRWNENFSCYYVGRFSKKNNGSLAYINFINV